MNGDLQAPIALWRGIRSAVVAWGLWLAVGSLASQSTSKTMTSDEIDSLWTIDNPVAGYQKLVEALKAHPDSADEIHTQICRSLGLQRRFADGWAELTKVSEHPSAIVKVRIQLEAGRLKNSSGDKKGSQPSFRKAFDLAVAGHFDYYAVDAAHMLAIATHGRESVRWNERALDMAGASRDARTRRCRGSLLNNLGWTYHDSGQFSLAMVKFQAAEAFQEQVGDPASVRIARWAIARCLRSMKRYSEAVPILEELVKLPEAGYASEELGEDLLALGKGEQAKPHFRRAYELLSQDGDIKEHEAARLQRLARLGS